MISIVDYGIGNIGSVANMLKHIGSQPVLASSIEEIKSAKALLLPGVGSFGVAMETLHRLGFVDPLRQKVLVERIPILGICLGMQLLGNGSEEASSNGNVPGLGFIDADFVKFSFLPSSSLKVPHMGWNTLSVARDNPLIDIAEEEQRFYFVHSYFAKCHDPHDVIATCTYGHEFVCAYGRDNILGTQFHPEKSHKFGMRLLRNFVKFAC